MNHRLLDELRAYKRSRVLASAITHGVLKSVRQGAASVDEISLACATSPDWTRSLLSAVASLGLVQSRNGRWTLTAEGCSACDDDVVQAFAGYHLHCFEAWLALPNKLSTTENKNGGGFHRQNVTDSDYVAAFLQSMEAIAKHNLPFLREQCHLTGRVLDVGAGPSTFCRDLAARQRSEVTGLDLPAVVHAAKRHFEFPSNYKWVACDFEEFMPTEFFDAVFCSHLLEYCPPDSLHQWLGKLRSFLNPSGATAFVIFLKPDERSSIDLDLFELSTGVNGSQLGHIWSIQEFRKTLSDAGAVNLRCIPIPEGASYSEYLVLAEWRGEENTR